MERVIVERLGHLGDGVAEGPVYAPRCLPGERVEGSRKGSELFEIRIIEPSPERVRPPCKHYKSCGGCQLQHASDAFVARWKIEVVERALAAHGLDVRIDGIDTSAPGSRRRAVLAARRGKSGATVGFHGRKSGIIVDVPECTLLRPALKASFPMIGELAMLGASRKHALSVSITETEAGVDLDISDGKPLTTELKEALATFVRKHDPARLSWDGEMIAQVRPPFHLFGRAWVVPPPGSFLQATREGEAALLNAVRSAVGDASRVVDLFAGCGTFALPLSELAEVLAIEGDAAMTAALDAGWRMTDGLKAVVVETRDLFRNPLEQDKLNVFDAVVLDPPRAGAAAQTAQIAESTVARVAYVSCNPVTFARDASVLCHAGFSLDRVRVVDQFRWSSHVELAAAFSRAK